MRYGPSDWSLYERGQEHTQRMSCEDEGRDWSGASTKHKRPGFLATSSSSESGMGESLPQHVQGTSLADVALGLLTSRTLRE